MYTRLCSPLLSKSFFLLGARGTGKTRLLNSILPKSAMTLWVDLLKEGEFLTFVKRPGELTSRIDLLSKRPDWVVIDEVQRVPAILNEVHSLIEERGLQFALTGSSARKLKRGGGNLLAGRALMNRLFPLTERELGEDFNLDEILNWGSLPQVCTARDSLMKSEILKTYVDVYLREEIREEQIVRRLDPFAKFLEVAAQTSGEIVNLSRLGREAGTDAKSVSRYFQILEETLVGFFLEPYHSSVRKRQRQQAKFFIFDIGVQRALEGVLRNPVIERTYEYGRLFEIFITLELHRLNDYTRSDYRFSYLKTQSQLEVDIIAERKGDETKVIEIKSAEDVDISEINKLYSLAKDFPKARSMIFCRTKVDRLINHVQVVNWKRGLKELF